MKRISRQKGKKPIKQNRRSWRKVKGKWIKTDKIK